MPLTIAERKHLMPHGAQLAVATEMEVSTTYVSAVMNGIVRPQTLPAQKKLRRVQVALARKLGRRVDEVFGGDSAPVVETAPAPVAIPA